MYRYADDSRTKIHEYAVISTLTILMSLIQTFSSLCRNKKKELHGRIPFLDTCLHVNQDDSRNVYVPQNDSFCSNLNFYSNHCLQQKRAAVDTWQSMHERVRTIVCHPIKSATTTTTILFCLLHRISYSKNRFKLK